MGLLSWFNIILIIFVAFGGVGVSIFTSGFGCMLNHQISSVPCQSFFFELGNNIIAPQVKMTNAVADLTNSTTMNAVPKEFLQDYINSKKAEIGWSIFATLVWFWLIVTALLKLPTFQNDLGTRVIVVIAAIFILLSAQSLFAMVYMKSNFVWPFEGFVRLAMNPEVVTMTAQSYLEVIGGMANPLPGNGTIV